MSLVTNSLRRAIYIIIPLLFFIFGCIEEKEEIRGHWHIYGHSAYEYFTLDFLGDSLLLFDKDAIFQSETGSFDETQKKLFIPAECGVGRMEYKIIGTKLFLDNENYNMHFTGQKCEEQCCNRLMDAQKDLHARFTAPSIKNIEKFKPIQLSNLTPLIPLVLNPTLDSSVLKIKTTSGEVELSELGTFLDQLKIKTHPDIFKYSFFLVYASNETPVQQLKTLEATFNGEGINRLLLACLKTNISKEEPLFEAIKLSDFNLNKVGRLGDFFRE